MFLIQILDKITQPFPAPTAQKCEFISKLLWSWDIDQSSIMYLHGVSVLFNGSPHVLWLSETKLFWWGFFDCVKRPKEASKMVKKGDLKTSKGHFEINWPLAIYFGLKIIKSKPYLEISIKFSFLYRTQWLIQTFQKWFQNNFWKQLLQASKLNFGKLLT